MEQCPMCGQKVDKILKEDLIKVIMGFKMVQGFRKDDKAWDKMYFRRFSRSAKELLEFFGNWKDAIDCIQDTYEKFKEVGLTVTLETVCKHAGEYKKDMQEKMGRSDGILPVPGNGNEQIKREPDITTSKP